MLAILKKPYFFNDSTSYRLSMSFGLTLFIMGFIILVQPFDLGALTSNITCFAFSSGVICLVNFLFFYFVIVNLSNTFFNPENWTIGKHFLCVFGVTLSISFFIWIYNRFIIDGELIQNMSFFLALKIVFTIGLVPFVLYFFIDEQYGRSTRDKISEEIMQEVNLSEKKLETTKEVKIFAQNNKDFIEFLVDDLVYINSQGNYTSFYTLDNNEIKEHILRVSLTSTNNKLSSFPSIFKCHKSYIVNTNFVNEITGNTRGYTFHIDEFEIDIPVSRQFNKKELLNYLK